MLQRFCQNCLFYGKATRKCPDCGHVLSDDPAATLVHVTEPIDTLLRDISAARPSQPATETIERALRIYIELMDLFKQEVT